MGCRRGWIRACVTSCPPSCGWDLWFIAGYGLATVLGAGLMLVLARSAVAKRWARFGMFAAITAVLADLFENLFLWLAVRGTATTVRLASTGSTRPSVPRGDQVLRRPSGAGHPRGCRRADRVPGRAVPRPPGAPATCSRPGRRRRPVRSWRATPGSPRPARRPTRSRTRRSPHRWARGYHVPSCGCEPTDPDGAVTGICLSGGGIRRASVALGALQCAVVARRRSSPARPIWCRSPAAGTPPAPSNRCSPRRAGRRARNPDTNVLSGRTASTAFLPGLRPEEDHLRRHTSYLAVVAQGAAAGAGAVGPAPAAHPGPALRTRDPPLGGGRAALRLRAAHRACPPVAGPGPLMDDIAPPPSRCRDPGRCGRWASSPAWRSRSGWCPSTRARATGRSRRDRSAGSRPGRR